MFTNIQKVKKYSQIKFDHLSSIFILFVILTINTPFF